MEARLVERAKIVLLAGNGKQDVEIAHKLGITNAKAGRWRGRYIDGGLRAIESDAPRAGRPRELSKEPEAKIIQTTQHPPEHQTHDYKRQGTTTLFAALVFAGAGPGVMGR